MQRNKKAWPIYEGKNQSIDNVPEKAQILDLLDKDFKLAILNMFRDKGNHVKRTKWKYKNDVSPVREHW